MEWVVSHLEESREVAVPAEDMAPLAEYWSKMRQLRAQVDESRLADAEVAITWTPEGQHG
jgi:hypothetical protein